jgi:hypothetical protein
MDGGIEGPVCRRDSGPTSLAIPDMTGRLNCLTLEDDRLGFIESRGGHCASPGEPVTREGRSMPRALRNFRK